MPPEFRGESNSWRDASYAHRFLFVGSKLCCKKICPSVQHDVVDSCWVLLMASCYSSILFFPVGQCIFGTWLSYGRRKFWRKNTRPSKLMENVWPSKVKVICLAIILYICTWFVQVFTEMSFHNAGFHCFFFTVRVFWFVRIKHMKRIKGAYFAKESMFPFLKTICDAKFHMNKLSQTVNQPKLYEFVKKNNVIGHSQSQLAHQRWIDISTSTGVVLPTAMAPMVAVKILQPNNGAEPAGYWGMSSSIYAKDGWEGLIPIAQKRRAWPVPCLLRATFMSPVDKICIA